uniref:Uncharacterized protein n=1 Tax=Rhizophora mucronata TaxID=61149 RepID=A0A2P2NML0_RHIMU
MLLSLCEHPYSWMEYL